ncbi:hypothetical protein J23TS9_15430 [Paenibacillus sp. J23TS9]|nr:hypothetical protein J23TS9_15430 [Paenibacillus sp. J23TS9]
METACRDEDDIPLLNHIWPAVNVENSTSCLHNQKFKMLVPMQVQDTIPSYGGSTTILKELKRIIRMLKNRILPQFFWIGHKVLPPQNQTSIAQD